MHADCFIRYGICGYLLHFCALGIADAKFSGNRGTLGRLFPEQLVENLSSPFRVQMQLVIGHAALANECHVLHPILMRTRHIVPYVVPPSLPSVDDLQISRPRSFELTVIFITLQQISQFLNAFS